MLDLARPLQTDRFPARYSGDFRRTMSKIASSREVLDQIAQRHATPDTYMSDAKRDLAEARAFVKSKNLLTLPSRDNLQVIDTPEFMRGIYAVGGFNPAPALEPQLGAFYWVTPIPKTWPRKAHRIQAARVQLLPPEAADHPRSHARPLRAVRVRQRYRAEIAPGARALLGQRHVCGRLGRVRGANDARRGLSGSRSRAAPDVSEGNAARAWRTPSSTCASRLWA